MGAQGNTLCGITQTLKNSALLSIGKRTQHQENGCNFAEWVILSSNVHAFARGRYAGKCLPRQRRAIKRRLFGRTPCALLSAFTDHSAWKKFGARLDCRITESLQQQHELVKFNAPPDTT